MPRGRRRLPDAVVALKGERRHHRQREPVAVQYPARPVSIEVPDFLTTDRARAIFRHVVEDYLQRRIARAPDFVVFGRWAYYLDRWIGVTAAAGELDQLNTLERLLRSLEDRLGLSPLARQDILRGLAAMPAAIGDVLSDNGSGATVPPVGETTGEQRADDLPSSAAKPLVSPLGFLKMN